MSSVKVANTSYIAKAGYVYQKRVKGGTISITLSTQDVEKATMRSASMSLRLLQIEPFNLPFVAIHATMKTYRDELVRERKIAALTAILSQTPVSAQEALSMPVATVEQVSAHVALKSAVESVHYFSVINPFSVCI